MKSIDKINKKIVYYSETKPDNMTRQDYNKLMNEIKVKGLSVNKCFQGRRFKTRDYKNYEEEVLYLLPKIKIPKGKLELDLVFGLSSKNADADNLVKPFADILQKKYGFNDKLFYKIKVEKIDVEKTEEFIKFKIKKYGKHKGNF
jgi:Holliday junction resolvase RusA-like endonuclease